MLKRFAAEQVLALTVRSRCSPTNPVDGVASPPSGTGAAVVDMSELEQLVQVHDSGCPLELAEALVIAHAVKHFGNGVDARLGNVKDALTTRCHALLVNFPWLLDPQLRMPMAQHGDREPLWSTLVRNGIDLDAGVLGAVAKGTGADHLQAMLDHAARFLADGSSRQDEPTSKLVELFYYPRSAVALYELGLPLKALNFEQLLRIAEACGNAAGHSERKYQESLVMLDYLVAKVDGQFSRQVMMNLPASEVLAQIDAAWASASTAHPIYAMFYAMVTTVARTVQSIGGVDTRDFPRRPLLELADRLNALMVADSRLPMATICPRELFKLAAMCTRARVDLSTRNFYELYRPFSQAVSNTPDDVLRYISTEHIGRGRRLMPEDLLGTGRDEEQTRNYLGSERFGVLEKLALENQLREGIERARDGLAADAHTGSALAARRRAHL